MPGHRFPGALIHLWLLDKSPWSWSTWQENTGLCNGLFTEEDSKLPLTFTRAKVDSIKAFFSEYNNIVSQDDKIKFVQRRNNISNAGREAWHEFTAALWKKSKLHDRIVQCLRATRIHPADICSINSIKPADVKAEDYIHLCLDAVGLELFGPDILDSSGLVAQPYRTIVRQIAMQSWEVLQYHLKKAATKLPDLREKAEDAIKCNYFHVYLLVNINLICPLQRSTTNLPSSNLR